MENTWDSAADTRERVAMKIAAEDLLAIKIHRELRSGGASREKSSDGRDRVYQ
jgi:hypothetical protein